MIRFKYTTLIFCLSLCIGQAIGQSLWRSKEFLWQSAIYALYSDSITESLFIGGQIPGTGGPQTKGFVYYQDTQFIAIPNTILMAPTSDFIRYKDQLYIAGAGGVKIWHGDDSVSIPGGGITGGGVERLRVFDDTLYAFGDFSKAGSITITNNMAKWDGTSWSKVGNYPVDNNGFDIQSILTAEFYKGQLYIGGYIFDDDGNCSILKGDGSNFTLPHNGIRGPFADAVSMVVFNDTLYVGGLFDKADGNTGNCIMSWDGDQWNEVGGGVTDGMRLTRLRVLDDKLYALGWYDSIGGIRADGIAYWYNQQWCALDGVFNNSISTVEMFNDTLWCGGWFDTISNQSIVSLARWTGGTYTDTCGNITLGITESVINEGGMRIYPNPAMDHVTIEFSSTFPERVDIINLQGQLLLSETIQSGERVDLSELPNGVYLLKSNQTMLRIIKD